MGVDFGMARPRSPQLVESGAAGIPAQEVEQREQAALVFAPGGQPGAGTARRAALTDVPVEGVLRERQELLPVLASELPLDALHQRQQAIDER